MGITIELFGIAMILVGIVLELNGIRKALEKR
jgi:hypothetical protein